MIESLHTNRLLAPPTLNPLGFGRLIFSLQSSTMGLVTQILSSYIFFPTGLARAHALNEQTS